MRDAFICDAIRTPIGRYAGSLAKVRADDLAAVPIKALMARNAKADWEKLDEVFFGDTRAMVDVLKVEEEASPYDLEETTFAGQSVSRITGPLRPNATELHKLLTTIAKG